MSNDTPQTSSSAAGIAVLARVHKDGKKSVIVARCDSSERFMANARVLSRDCVDWQSSFYTSLSDAKSGLMNDYGIGWFNIARSRVRELESKIVGHAA